MKVKNLEALREVREHQRQGHLKGQTTRVQPEGAVQAPLPQRSGDLQWWVLHGPWQPMCFTLKWILMWMWAVYCVTCLNLYIICLLNVIVSPLLSLLSAVCGKMGVGFSDWLYVPGPGYVSFCVFLCDHSF